MRLLATAILALCAAACRDGHARGGPPAECATLLRVAGAGSCHAAEARLKGALEAAGRLGAARWSCLRALAVDPARDRAVTAAVLGDAFAREPARERDFRGSADPRLRAAAVAALVIAPREPALTSALAALADRDPTVRAEALAVLARQAPGPELAPQIAPSLHDPAAAVRAAAASTLAAARASDPALLALLDDPDREVVVHAIYAIKALRISAPRLRALSTSPDGRIRAAALAALSVAPEVSP